MVKDIAEGIKRLCGEAEQDSRKHTDEMIQFVKGISDKAGAISYVSIDPDGEIMVGFDPPLLSKGK